MHRQQLRAGGPVQRRARKKRDGSGGQAEQTLGRSCGGFGAKIHAAVTPTGHPVALKLTGGQAGDCPRLPELIAGQPTQAAIADKAYDSDGNRQAIARQGAPGAIPPKKSRKAKIEYDRHLYKERHVVECRFGKLKQRRCVATRYEKKAANFLGFVWLATINAILL